MIGLFKGLATTLSTFTRKPVTIEYPDEKHVLPVRQRSFPVLTWDFDHDEPFCTGCNVCVRNCPVDCMTATMQDNPNYSAGTSDRRKIVEKFWIDYGRCMRCNICVEVCPFEAIVMDNNWTGHEHASYDRRDLHMDIDDLTRPSRTGQLVNPFRPQDRIELIERRVAGQEPPEETFKAAKPQARQLQMERIAHGEAPAIRLRPPEAPKAPARGAAGAGGAAAAARSILTDAEGNPLSANKIRAKRMRAERAASEAQAAGEAIPADVMEVLVAVGSKMAPPEARAAAATAGGGAAAPRAASPILTDAEGNPLSANKIRAKRMRAEKDAKAALDAGQAIPAEVMEVLVATDSEMAPPEARAAAAAPAAAVAAAAPLLDAEGNPLSENKVRAMRMRAERAAKVALEGGQEIPGDVMQVLIQTGSSMAPAPAAAPAAAAATAVLAPPTDADGNPLSENKARAMRMRAERQARELLARGEEIPADVVALIQSLGGTVPTGG